MKVYVFRTPIIRTVQADKCAAVGFHQYVEIEFKSELYRKS